MVLKEIHPTSSLPPKFLNILSVIFILVMTFFVYFPTIKNDFVNWDDDVHLLNNLSVRSLDMENIKEIFSKPINKIYVPLSILSYALEYRWFGYNPKVYHFDNLLLHLLITVLIFRLSLRLGLSTVGAFVATIIFAIHPIHVESVGWVTERKDVLYTLFYLLALWMYLRYLSVEHALKKERYFDLFMVTFLGLLSMLAKPMALSLPLILFLMDWFNRRKIQPRIFLEKIPLCLLIAGIGWITYLPHARVPGNNVIEGCLIWVWTFVFYIRQFVFPIVLVPIYQLPEPISFANVEYSLSMVIVVALTWAAIRFRKHRWWMWALGYYFFSIFFLLRYDYSKDTNIVADRFMYLSCLGFCHLLGYWSDRIFFSVQEKLKILKKIFALVLILIITTLAVKTFKQCQVWKNSISLWQHQLKFYPDQHIALNNLATAFRDLDVYIQAEKRYLIMMQMKSEGQNISTLVGIDQTIKMIDQLIAMFQKAIQLEPTYVDAQYNLAKLYQDLGLIEEAVAAYNKTLALDPNYKDTHVNMGQMYQDFGQFDKAVEAFRRALELNPNDEDLYVDIVKTYNKAIKSFGPLPFYEQARDEMLHSFQEFIRTKSPRARSYFNFGVLYDDMGDYERAISAYRMALDINPNYVKALYNLTNIYLQAGQLKTALSLYEKIINIDPRFIEAYLNIGVIESRLGNSERAIASFNKILKIDPQNAKAYFNLGFIQQNTGKITQAIEFYKRAIESDSSFADAYYNLGNVYASIKENDQAMVFYQKAVEVNPKHMNAFLNLSIVSFHKGDFKAAIKYLDEARLLGYGPPQRYLRALEPYREGSAQ